MKYVIHDGCDIVNTNTMEIAKRIFEDIEELYEDDFQEYIDDMCSPIEIFGETFYASNVLLDSNPDKFYKEFEKWFHNAFRYTVDDVRYEVERMGVGEKCGKFCGEKIEFSVTRLE